MTTHGECLQVHAVHALGTQPNVAIHGLQFHYLQTNVFCLSTRLRNFGSRCLVLTSNSKCLNYMYIYIYRNTTVPRIPLLVYKYRVISLITFMLSSFSSFTDR